MDLENYFYGMGSYHFSIIEKHIKNTYGPNGFDPILYSEVWN